MCMCGDICCLSCGPAQGNIRCSVCRAWVSEGGCEDPEKCQREEAKQSISAEFWESLAPIIDYLEEVDARHDVHGR